MRLRIRNKEDLKKAPRNAQGGLDLRRANLAGADLTGADLKEADLIGANLQRADLRDADLRYADLWRANLRLADLMGADLKGAYLRKTNFRSVHLNEVDFTGARLNWVSHDLISAVLEEAARGDKEKITAAILIRTHTKMCWRDFVLEGSFGEFEHLKPWAISVLKRYDGFIDQVFAALEEIDSGR